MSGALSVRGGGPPRDPRGCAGVGGRMRFGLANRGRRGISSTPEGALGVGALCVSGSQSVAGVEYDEHYEYNEYDDDECDDECDKHDDECEDEYDGEVRRRVR